jgi:hypothetical protein
MYRFEEKRIANPGTVYNADAWETEQEKLHH